MQRTKCVRARYGIILPLLQRPGNGPYLHEITAISQQSRGVSSKRRRAAHKGFFHVWSFSSVFFNRPGD
jgi:hypothetical protein